MKNIICILALLFSLMLKAQQPPVAFTYVHIDKNTYTPGETIWLKAYLPANTRLNETLLVRVADDKKNIVVAREFPAYDLRAHGQLVLPDTLSAGSYTLLAYGNNTGPDANDVFTQSIKVIDNTDGVPVTAVTVGDGAVLAPGNPITLTFGLQRNGRPVADTKGRYTLTIPGQEKPIVSDKFRTDANGQATTTFTYPDIGLYDHITVTGTFNDNKPVPFNLILPSQKKKITLTATPEGGVAVAGVANGIAIETTDDAGQPVNGVSVSLLENGSPVATMMTDIQGLALIHHTLKEAAYSVAASLPAEGFSAQVPLVVQNEGLALTLQDGGKLMVRNHGPKQHARLELWCEGQVFFEKDLALTANALVPIVLPPPADNRLISAALYNQLGQLTNERLFYSGTKNGYNIMVDFGSGPIVTRQNVSATVSVTDFEGNPIRANLSAAVVHHKLLDKKRYKTITASRYSATGSTTALQQVLPLGPAAVNLYLANKKWRGNLPVIATDTLHSIKAGVAGSIVRRKKRKNDEPLKQFIMITPDGPGVILPDAEGNFYITPESLLVQEGQDCFLFFNDGELGTHNLTFSQAGPDFEKKWLDGATFYQPAYTLQQQTETLPDIPGAIKIKEVVVGKKHHGFSDADYQKWVRDYPSNCRDWVCLNNILNCTNHPTGTTPRIGQKYAYQGREILYTQCILGSSEPEKVVLLKSITMPVAFPETTFEDEYDLKYYTTLAWMPNIDTDANGKATVQFTASDLEGKFLMILQGLNIENNDAIYGEAEVKVTGGR